MFVCFFILIRSTRFGSVLFRKFIKIIIATFPIISRFFDGRWQINFKNHA